MAKYSARIDASDFIVGLWRGPGPEIPAGSIEITEGQATQIGGTLKHVGAGGSKWKLINSVLTAQDDTRPILRFTPAALQVMNNAADIPILIEVVNEAGVVRSNVNGFKTIPLHDDRRLRVVFANGQATVQADAAIVGDMVINNNESFRVVTPFKLRVFEDKLSVK